MTFVRPVYEEFTLTHGNDAVRLRPSLSAAHTLVSRHGLPALFEAVAEGNFTIISEIILTACLRRQDGAAFLLGFSGRPLAPLMNAIAEPLSGLCACFMPEPPKHTAKSSGSNLPWPDYYRALFDRATGWLSWTPDRVWQATPNEIERAFAAHVEMLKAIHGGNDDATDPDQAAQNIAEGLDPEFDRKALYALKAKIRSGH